MIDLGDILRGRNASQPTRGVMAAITPKIAPVRKVIASPGRPSVGPSPMEVTNASIDIVIASTPMESGDMDDFIRAVPGDGWTPLVEPPRHGLAKPVGGACHADFHDYVDMTPATKAVAIPRCHRIRSSRRKMSRCFEILK
ncbi:MULTISPECIES: hypothetical protein [Pseudooceanicola]|uniref:hypothetical protein n=1 Tax=Pseudooceanicola TaxID=1679449 RepID=UPI001926C041|nr:MULTISPECIES: hypothetical protein [Pseudooceanicola]